MLKCGVIVWMFAVGFRITLVDTALVYPTESGSACWGLFVAIAVPLELPHRNVFLSYNFEANYNLPWHAENIIPGPLQKFEGYEDGLFKGRSAIVETNSTEESDSESRSSSEDDVSPTVIPIPTDENSSPSSPANRTSRSLISRKVFYGLMNEKLKYAGMKGKPCVLKMICEINSFNLSHHNGVLGHLFHILFSPSSSKDENLSRDYYKAEINGRNGNCDIYDKICPRTLLDLITFPVDSIINKFM
ncbi:hypothetical protein ACFFRR_004351 [Megaselia abdita]